MRKALIALTLLLALGGLAYWVLARRTPQWTTHSPEALEQLQQGFDADMKYYREDAAGHYRRALEYDPTFVIAKWRLLLVTPMADKDTRKQLTAELKQADTGRLNPRERLLVDYFLARVNKENAHAEKLLGAYLHEHPHDPFALSIRCQQAWERRDLAEAESCDRELLAVDPNWVQAQNELGYIAMGQGHFAEAERLFRTYLFIAPDQANPHDSLGELLTLLGHYADAERELEEAIRIKPTFCASWSHLILLHAIAGDCARLGSTLQRLRQAGSCPRDEAFQACRVALWDGVLRGDYQAAWQGLEPCTGKAGGEVSVLGYRVALLTEHREAAEAMTKDVHEGLEYAEKNRTTTATVAHMEGMREMVDRHLPRAAELLAAADQNLDYGSDGVAVFKLFNRLDLAAALRSTGRAAEATRTVDAVAAVNADFAKRFLDLPPRPR